MTKLLTILSMTLLTATVGNAIEPKNPSSVCDRFAAPLDKSKCEEKMKKDSPDWYLAGVCSKQFDDASFYECVDLGKSAKFSPLKIQDCDNTTASDETRLACLKEIAQSNTGFDQYQGRRPAKEDDRWKYNGYSPSRFAK